MRIAVVGAGIAGLGAAWALARRHDVTVYEKDERPGGHANTARIDYDGRAVDVDTGFIVYNEANYPNLVQLFAALGVETIPSDMSFGVSLGGGRVEWAGDNVGTLFAQKRNLLSLSHHAMWMDIVRFNRQATDDLASGRLDGLTLGDYLSWRRFGAPFRDRYLLPMGAAIWSTAQPDMLNFPAKSLIAFFDNHRLLAGFNTGAWRTVRGGSRRYVDRLLASFAGTLRTACGVASVTRDFSGVTVRDEQGGAERYDEIVFASHPDQTLAALADADGAERSILKSIRYAPNRAVLHRDARFMPRRTKVWSSWNYVAGHAPAGDQVSLTYWMNRLQSIDRSMPLFVTLNPAEPPRAEMTFGRFDYAHPQFDLVAQQAQQRLGTIQGARRTWFCGAWCGYGFHEDGLTAGLEVAARLGAPAPWATAALRRLGPPKLAAAE